VWTRAGQLVFTSIQHGCLYVLTRGGARVLVKTAGGPNGLTEGADGVLYVAQNGGIFGGGQRSSEPAPPGIQHVRDTSVGYLLRGLDAPNDLCFGPDGRLYVTDPRDPFGPNARPGRIYALAADGTPELLAEGPAYTNGIAFGPDAAWLYVAETLKQRVLRYAFEGGRLGAADVFCTTEPGFPDGICFDEDGRLYVAATVGRAVLVFDGDGQRIGSLSCGDTSMPTNCCFGGPDGKTLFVTDSAGARVVAFDLDVRGLPLYPFR